MLIQPPPIHRIRTDHERATRDGFGDALVLLGQTKPEIVVLTGDLSESVRAKQFQVQFPERFIECGVAEQNMVGVAAGLALCGKIPFVTSYAVFMPGRTWDQIRVSICYSQANVKLVGGHTGLNVGQDGATHQALEDLSLMRVLPNMTVIVPCDADQAKQATLAIAAHMGPCYLRLTRAASPTLTDMTTPFVLGQMRVVKKGNDITIAACGPLLTEVVSAAKWLAGRGVSVEILDCHTLKPFDTATLIKSVKKTGCLVTVEEHQRSGGLYSAACEALAGTLPTPIEAVAVEDRFGQTGTPEELFEYYGLTAVNIVTAVTKVKKRVGLARRNISRNI